MKFLRNLRFLFFIIPLFLLSLSFLYKDNSYLVISILTFILLIFLIFPKIIPKSSFSLSIKRKAKKQNNTKVKINTINKTFFKNKNYLYFIAATIIFLLFFTYVGAYFIQVVNLTHNVILDYYLSQIFALKLTGIFLIILFCALVIAGSGLVLNKDRKVKFKFQANLLSQKISFALGAVLVAFILSIVALYIYAILQLNLSVIATQITPGLVGISYGKDDINNKLKAMDTVPQVIGTDHNLSNTVLSVVINGSSNQNSFYQIRILKSIPYFLTLPFNISNKPVIFVHNTLIISSIDKDTIQTISPALARLFFKKFFKNRVLKDDPKVIVLSRQEYLSFRQDEINNEVKKYDDAIQKLADYISTVQSDIYLSNQKISYNQNGIQLANGYKSSAYSDCMNAGSYDYYSGSFFHYYTQDQCNSQASQYDSTIAQFQQNVNDWNSRLQTDEGYLSDAENAEKLYQTARDYTNSQKDTTPDELGKFNDPNTVRVVLDSTSPKGINEFLETLIHENLHYQSFIKDRQFEFSDKSYDGFWEEGLTEYFARKIALKDLGVNVNQGYPLIVKIVAQMTRKIPESTLEEIYFDKDNATLQATLNTAYGDTFYKDTEPYFEYLSILPDNLQVKYANDIMTRIGGKQLSTKDLYSTDLQPN